MKDNTMKLVRSARKNSGKALMVLSLIGMMGMNVSAANGHEFTDINKDVNVSKYNLSLNANGRIEYDKNLDGNKEVFYDYLDYQKLEKSLTTVDKNETELKNRYTELYNLAEKNRKDLINTWNRFGLLKLNGDAKYVTGESTASIKGAMNAMPIHNISDIKISLNSDMGVKIDYPNPKWGVYRDGAISTDAINQQIANALTHEKSKTIDFPNTKIDLGERHNVRYVDATEAMRHTEKKAINTPTEIDLGEFHKVRYIDASALKNTHTERYDMRPDEIEHDFGESHNVRRVNAQAVYDKGKADGIKIGEDGLAQQFTAKLGKLEIWNGVADGDNDYESTWDDSATQTNGVVLYADKVETVLNRTKRYVYWDQPDSVYADVLLLGTWGAAETIEMDGDKPTGWVYKGETIEGNIRYVVEIKIYSNTSKGHSLGPAGKYHVGNVKAWTEIL